MLGFDKGWFSKKASEGWCWDLSSQQSTHLLFRGKANQLKASEVRGRRENMYSRVMSRFQSCYNAFRREHVPSTYFEFVTFTWLSKEHSFKTFFYVSLYSEEDRCVGKSGSLYTQRSKLTSRTGGKTFSKKQGTGLFFNPCTDRYRSKTSSSRPRPRIGATWCVWCRGSRGRCESSIQKHMLRLPDSSQGEEKAK